MPPLTFSKDGKFTKKSKNQQNQARKHDNMQSEAGGEAEEEDPTCLQLATVEIDVEISSVEKDNRVSESVNQVPLTPDISPFKANGKRKSTPKKRPKQNPLEAESNACMPPVHGGSELVSAPSEVSIISAAAVEELSDLRSYYSKQLQRINYISHECLKDSDSGVLTCSRGPLKSLRLPSRSSISRTVRSLWMRVSTRRKLIRK